MATKKQTKEVSIIDKLTPVLSSINLPKIVDEHSMTEATEVLSQANKYLKDLIADKETMTKPINESLKVIRAKYKPLEIKLEGIIANIRSSMTSYQTEQMRLQKIEEDKIASRIGEGKGKLKFETATNKIENLDKAVDKVNTASGKISFKTVKKFEVVDLALVPVEYHLANETAIRNAMVANLELPGVRYYTEQVPINNLR